MFQEKNHYQHCQITEGSTSHTLQKHN